VPVACADRETHAAVKLRRAVEIANRMNDMIEAARHDVLRPRIRRAEAS
jgi:hypothetical protein